MGYGESGSVPHIFFLREGQMVDVGILKLFLSRKQVNLSYIAQSSPFVVSRGTAPPRIPELKNVPIPWDTVEIPVVQRCAVPSSMIHRSPSYHRSGTSARYF